MALYFDRRTMLAMAGATLLSRPALAAESAPDTINFSYQTGDINVLLMYVVGTGLFEKHGVLPEVFPNLRYR